MKKTFNLTGVIAEDGKLEVALSSGIAPDGVRLVETIAKLSEDDEMFDFQSLPANEIETCGGLMRKGSKTRNGMDYEISKDAQLWNK